MLATMPKFKPTVKVLCKLGTVAHNRPFNARELAEYADIPTASAARHIGWLVKHRLVHAASAGAPPTYTPTSKGWNMIARACTR